MNFRNNSFQNNSIPGGYQSPVGSSYNSQLYGRGRATMRGSNVPVHNNMYPTYNQGSYYYGGNARYPNSYGSYMGYNCSGYVPRASCYPQYPDMYSSSRALEVNNRRLRYNAIADPVAKERRRWSYEKDNTLSDSYNYDDYHDDVYLRDRNFRKNYKTRFFTKLAKNKKLKLNDLEDERDTEFYSSRRDRLKNRRKARDNYESDYEDDYEDEDYEYDDYEDEKDSRKRKLHKRSKSRYEDEENDEDDYEDEDYEYDDYEDEKDSRKRKLHKRSKSRYEDEENDEDEVYDSMSRRSRFVSGPIDFFKKKRRV